MSTFDYLSSRILTHYKAIKDLREGMLPYPRFLILYLTYSCPARCSYCEYKHDLGDTELNAEVAYRVLHEAHYMGVEGVEFCGGGEPTMHPEFMSLVNAATQQGLRVGVLTNGWGLVSVGGLAELLAEQASYVRVSLDAATAETWEKIKGFPSSMWDKLIHKLWWLTANSDGIVSGKFLITPENYTEIPEMVALCRDHNLGSAQFKMVRHTQQMTKREQIVATGLLEYAKYTNTGYSVIGDFSRKQIHQRCWLNPLHTLIDADGSVYLCCYFRHRKATHRIGNVNRQNLCEVWGSPEHKAALKSINIRECNLFDCRFAHYHDIVNSTICNGYGQFEFL